MRRAPLFRALSAHQNDGCVTASVACFANQVFFECMTSSPNLIPLQMLTFNATHLTVCAMEADRQSKVLTCNEGVDRHEVVPWGDAAAGGWSLGDRGLCPLGDRLRFATNTPACTNHNSDSNCNGDIN